MLFLVGFSKKAIDMFCLLPIAAVLVPSRTTRVALINGNPYITVPVATHFHVVGMFAIFTVTFRTTTNYNTYTEGHYASCAKF